VIAAIAVALIAVLLLALRGRREGASSKQEPEGAEAELAQGRGGAARGSRAEGGAVIDPSASVSVFGTVTALRGGVLVGARVCARSKRGESFAPPRCTRSDDEGRYHLAAMPPADYWVTAAAAEHQPKRQAIELRPGAERRLDIELLTGGVLVRGQVFDLSGGEIEGALVSIGYDPIAGDPREQSWALSDGEGRFEAWVRGGHLRVSARAEGYSPRSLFSTAPGPTIELYLIPEAVLVGRVVDALTREPIADVELHTGRDGGTTEFFVDTSEGQARSGADGGFRIAGLRPGTYRPFVANGAWRGRAEYSVKLGLGETSGVIEVPVVRSAQVRAQVVYDDGEAACIGEMAALHPIHGGMSSYHAQIGAQGWVEVGGLPAADYEVTLHCHGRMFKDVGRFSVAVGDDFDPALRWTVARGFELRGLIVDGQGEPVPGQVVVSELIPGDEDERGPTARKARSEASDRDGAFVLRDLEPGRYTLSLGGSSGPSLSEVLEVEVRAPGLEGVRIEVPVSAGLHGRVVDPEGRGVPNITVSAYGENGAWRDLHSADDGSFAFAVLSPDRYRVVALDGRWQLELAELSVVLEAGGDPEVTLEIPRADGLIRGLVVDDGGTPIDDAFVSLVRQAEALDRPSSGDRLSYSDAEGRPVLTDPDGRFEIGELPAGLYTVWAKQKQGGEATAVDVRPGARLELVIPAVASVSGTVVIPGEGAAPARFSITASLADGSFEERDAWDNSDGSWRLEDLPPGAYTLRVSSEQGDASFEVELSPGEERSGQRIELEPRVTLRGRIVDASDLSPVAGAKIRVRLAGRPWQFGEPSIWTLSGAEGRFTIVAPGGSNELGVTPPGSVAGRRHSSLKLTLDVRADPELGESAQELGDLALDPT